MLRLLVSLAATLGAVVSGPLIAASAEPSQTWPKTIADAKAEAAAKLDMPPDIWPAADITVAKARCNNLLGQIQVVAVPEPAMKSGDCGTPAPVRIISIGKHPEVAISPPALVTCDMAAALHNWVTNKLQPLAKKYLGGQLIRIDTMSDYSCRTAYGRRQSRLSEHGRANALDIRGFVTQTGATVALLDHWGPTARAIQAEVAAAKAAAVITPSTPTAAVGSAGATANPSRPTSEPVTPGPGTITASTAVPAALLNAMGSAAIRAVGGDTAGPNSELGLKPSQLGGPKPPASTPAATDSKTSSTPFDADSGRSRFLREAHATACRIFGTVLGPEANNAHSNHFHVDMAQRDTGSYCQ